MTKFTEIYKNISGKTATTIPQTARSSRGKNSFGIVCSAKNGKRITLTASLSKALRLDDTLFITAYAEDRVIILSSHTLNDDSIETNLKGSDNKISYNAGLVHFLKDTFGLDFTNRVCLTYHDIVFNNNAQDPMAILTFPEGQAGANDVQEAENENFDED